MISSQKERAYILFEEKKKIKIYDARCQDSIYCCTLARCFWNIEVACSSGPAGYQSESRSCGFTNPESRPKVRMQIFEIRDP
jgi:hypothetical protein